MHKTTERPERVHPLVNAVHARLSARASILALLLASLAFAPGCHAPAAEEWTTMQPIGRIRTPYLEHAPHQPLRDPAGEFRLELDPHFEEGLRRLDSFRYAYVIWAFDKSERDAPLLVHPPWTPEENVVGVFASRSPSRPNPIALSVVEILNVEGTTVRISSIDAFDGTPILDIKPYVEGLDSREQAGFGWIDELPDKEHMRLHIQGVAH